MNDTIRPGGGAEAMVNHGFITALGAVATIGGVRFGDY